jgi:AAA+ ATPase superfamily predicted ATPase
MFVGRAQELSRLRQEFASNRPSLLVVYGRRRIGKSTLLREAASDRPHVLYQATRVTAALNLEALKVEIGRSLGGDDILNGLGDWLSVLTYLARKAEALTGLVVVLDEFPYLVEVDPSLPSILQKFWDSGSPAT